MPHAPALKPLLFVAMPYGIRTEPHGTREMDFDRLYQRCIEPAALKTDVEVIRADQEAMGGIVHKAMYERLVLSEIVIADLTFANANVFYELGVRHASRPRATILIAAQVGELPFDIKPARVIPYAIDEAGRLEKGECEKLRSTLTERLVQALDEGSPDSPPFQLLDAFPGIDLPRETTDTFRSRAKRASELSVRIHRACRLEDPAAAIEELRKIERVVTALRVVEEQLLVELLLGYRDLSAWSDMARLAGEMPERLGGTVMVRQLLAFALNRRDEHGDRARAVALIEDVLEEEGPSAESLGILGRCFKDWWLELHEANHPGAAAALDDAIDAYDRAFRADPLDFYPTINLLTLLTVRNRPGDENRRDEAARFVLFDIGRLSPRKRREYWTVATQLEYAALEGKKDVGDRALAQIAASDAFPWMRRATAKNLAIVADAHDAAGRDSGWLRHAITELDPGPG